MDSNADSTNAQQCPSYWVRFVPKIDTRGPNWKPDDECWRDEIEPRIAALIQAEHVGLLVGSGLTRAIARAVGVGIHGMERPELQSVLGPGIAKVANDSAAAMGRGKANIEDDIRAITQLIGGLDIIAAAGAVGVQGPCTQRAGNLSYELWLELNGIMVEFAARILNTEQGIRARLQPRDDEGDQVELANNVRRLLCSFLLTFASRTASRDRLHVFTTNYDRLLELACDLAGIHILDRFVGSIEPVFRSGRIGLDLHYCPPGIRGEPRYVEGVVRLTKLHGSLDWRFERGLSGRSEVIRVPLPFGADPRDLYEKHDGVGIIIYPNAAKDVETLEYPYADLFRDFAAAACQPNSVIVTYGYGFGDDHINRVLRDMLTIPSTHLLIMAYDDADNRIRRFDDIVGRPAQVSILVGPEFASLDRLVGQYLPKPAIDNVTWRLAEIVERRASVARGLEEMNNRNKSSSEPGDPQ